MIDRLRHDIQQRLEQLLAEAEKLRHALAALAGRDGATPPTPERSVTARAQDRGRPSRQPRPSTGTRSGATRNAVLAALANGDAMTAGEVATATGLGRASVSTTLSRLAKTGEVSKAERGYRLA